MKIFKIIEKLSLKMKLLASFMCLAGLLLVVGVMSFLSFKKTESVYRQILNTNLIQERAVVQMNSAAKEQIRHLSKLSLMNLDEKATENVIKQIDTIKQNYTKNEKLLELSVQDEDQKKILSDLNKTWNSLNGSIDEILMLYKKNSGNPDRLKLINVYYSDLEESIELMLNQATDLGLKITESSSQAENQAQSIVAVGNNIVIGSVLAGFILALTLGITLAQYLSKNITYIANELDQQAGLIVGVSEVLIEGSENVRQKTFNQIESIKDIKSIASHINDVIKKNAQNAKVSTNKSKDGQVAVQGVRQAIEKLHSTVLNMNEGTKQMVGEIQESQNQLESVVNLIKEISLKTQVINDIVFQTKILSFNASVEAARAGESGKGFAIVAQEIGNLASSSGYAANEISNMLNKSIKTVEEMVEQTKNKINHMLNLSEINSEEGEKSSSELTNLFSSVELNMEQVLECMDDIEKATYEGSRGVDSIRNAFEDLANLANESSEVANSFETQACSLKEQSTSVMVAVHKLQSIVNSSDSKAA